MSKDREIYHITHLDNLLSVITSRALLADSFVRAGNVVHTRIGYEHIKERRLRRSVPVAAKGFLGDYVPFNFCPRSVMLYVISIGNVPGYDGGQENVIHLVSTVNAAKKTGNPWAFTDRHADLGYAVYFEKTAQLAKLDWDAIEASRWGGPGNDETKERKQAEFLVHERFPWTSVTQIGVISEEIAKLVKSAIRSSAHKPDVLIRPEWYY